MELTQTLAPQLAPQPYILVLGHTNIAQGINANDSLIQILHWIGFRTAAQQAAIVADCFDSFDSLQMLSEKDVHQMSTDFSGRTVANGKIIFGTNRTKFLKAVAHWVRDFNRVSESPTIVGLNESSFKSALQRSLARTSIRKTLSDSASITSKAADPGPLKSEKQWKEWEEKFINYLRCQVGSDGVPLNYIIRSNDAPNTSNDHPDFVSKTISCAPLQGEYYDADKLAVFNMLVSFTTGQPSGDWIKSTTRYSDGRRSMAALRAHFAGEGNATRNVAEADRLKETLHYKGERAMPFETFLTQLQRMFNIYEKEEEGIPEDQKVRLLFKKVQHKDLESAKSALQAQQTMGNALTYLTCANHLSARVSELPEYLSKNRNVSGLNTREGSGGSGGNGSESVGIYNTDGSIRTGHISNWKSLSNDDRELVKKARNNKKRNSTKGGDGKGGNSNNNTIKQLKSQNSKFKRQIKALKRSSTNDDSKESDEDNDDELDAGDQFGGKNARKRKKNVGFKD